MGDQPQKAPSPLAEAIYAALLKKVQQYYGTEAGDTHVQKLFDAWAENETQVRDTPVTAEFIDDWIDGDFRRARWGEAPIEDTSALPLRLGEVWVLIQFRYDHDGTIAFGWLTTTRSPLTALADVYEHEDIPGWVVEYCVRQRPGAPAETLGISAILQRLHDAIAACGDLTS